MTTRHGLYRKLPLVRGSKLGRDEGACIRFGLLHVANWISDNGPDPASLERGRQIHRHMGTILRRMTHCAYMLASEMQQADEAFEQRREFRDCSAQLANGSILADQLPTYFGMIVDDVAQLTVLALGLSGKIKVDNMGSLKSRDHAAVRELDLVRPLLDALEAPGSWWQRGFRSGKGMRQLLVHLQHLVEFQGSSSEGGPLTVKAFLHVPIGQERVGDWIEYFDEMRELLADFATWCDRVEAVLAPLLSIPESIASRVTAWVLPTEYSLGCHLYGAKYQVLPVCDGADPLPWTIRVEPIEGGLALRNE